MTNDTENNNFITRLSSIIGKSGDNKKTFAKKCGVSEKQLYIYLKGTSEPSMRFFMGMKKQYPWVNIDWLINGGEEEPSRAGSGNVVPIDPAVGLVMEVEEELGVRLNEKQRKAVVEIMRKELNHKLKEQRPDYHKSYNIFYRRRENMSSDLKNVLAKAIMENADEKKAGNSVSQITVGDGNVQVNGDNNKFITTQKHVENIVVETKPGIEHITEEQAYELGEKVKEIVTLENLVRKGSCTYQKVWGALNSQMKVRRFRLIPLNKYADAVKYLNEWMGRLNNSPAAKKKDPNFRNKLYGTIKPIIKKLGMEERLDALLMGKYSVTSIKDLSDDDLKKVRNTVRSWQKTAENKTEG